MIHLDISSPSIAVNKKTDGHRRYLPLLSSPPRLLSRANPDRHWNEVDMAAILIKRKSGNWASRERGVVVVFCIIGALAILLIGLFIHKKLAARKARALK